MDEQKQQQLRELAQLQLVNTSETAHYTLAQGTLELLSYVDELVAELEMATESCCEAMYLVYENSL
jgi:hypothetical protein